MRKIRIAQIGVNTESHAVDIFRTLEKLNDHFEIVGYALPENERERLPKRADQLAGYPELTLEEILNDPSIEAVTVETDEIYLSKYARLAAEAGKAIHMEKPGGTDPKEFEAMIDAVKKGGRTLSIGYMYRFNPFVRDALAKAKNGELGEILSVEAQMNCCHSVSVRNWLKDFPGGMMFFLGCHLIDLIVAFQGFPDEVIPLNCSSGTDGVTSDDFGMAILKYPHGVSFAKTSAVEKGGFLRRQLVVNGTLGTVEIKPLEQYLPDFSAQQTFRTVRTSPDWHQRYEAEASAPYDRYKDMMTAFADCVCGVAENPYTPDYELKLYRTILKACGVNTI